MKLILVAVMIVFCILEKAEVSHASTQPTVPTQPTVATQAGTQPPAVTHAPAAQNPVVTQAPAGGGTPAPGGGNAAPSNLPNVLHLALTGALVVILRDF